MRSILSTLCALSVLCGALLNTGCLGPARTPQAKVFATLQAAAVGIDSFRADYEAAWRAGDLAQEDFRKLDEAYNAANEAIITAAQALDAGLLATTPGHVEEAAQALLDLVLRLVPPQHRANSTKWRI
jgi:hypothetical protein